MEFNVLKVALIGIGPFSREDVVILAPHNQRRGLMLTEILLPLGIEWWIRAIAVQQCQLNLTIAGAIEEVLIHRPRVWANHVHIANAIGILPLRCFQRDQESQLALILRRSVLPVGLDRLPKLSQPLLVGIAILNDQGLHPLWIFSGNAIANRSTVIHHVETVFFQIDRGNEFLHDLSQMIKRVVKFIHTWHRTIAIPWIIRGNQMEAIGKVSDQIAEHVRRGWKAM